MNKQHLLLEQ